MRNQYDLGDNEDDEVVDYAKWIRKTRLADWRIFAVLMLFVAIFAASMYRGETGLSLFSGLSDKIVSWGFVLSIVFYAIWGINLYKVISRRGFQCVTISGIWFMGYPIVMILVTRIIMTIGLWLYSKQTMAHAWDKARTSLKMGGSLSFIFLSGLILLFMGICFSAQQEVAEQKRRVERL